MTSNDVCAADVIVIGSGAGGLSAAISSALNGLSVIVLEKSGRFGGTTARSGGMMWVPGNSLASDDGLVDSDEDALAYIEAEAGEHFQRERVATYLRSARQMMDAYARQTSAVRFVRSDVVADNHFSLPGARSEGRTVTMPPFDGRALSGSMTLLAPALPSLTFLGMQIQPGEELDHFLYATRSGRSAWYVARRLLRQAWDVIRFGQTTKLANGRAVAGRLLKSAIDLGVQMIPETDVKELIISDGRVTGCIAEKSGRLINFAGRNGVVLATGGFVKDQQRRARLTTVGDDGDGRFALGLETNFGDGIAMAERAGAAFESDLPNAISWTPVSVVPSGSGPKLFPHGFDRGKPGVIAVAPNGRRFFNESAVGSDFIRAMAAACGNRSVHGYLILNHRALRRYGVGIVRPAPVPFNKHIRSGYLKRAKTLEGLARALKIDPVILADTVGRFNEAAALGVDAEFGRGASPLDRRNGDPAHEPNPALGPLDEGPFYAVRILPGDFSTLAGLRGDLRARVLDHDGGVIPGLYAVGNDLNTMMGGQSVAGGATLGPAITWGYVAGNSLASHTEG